MSEFVINLPQKQADQQELLLVSQLGKDHQEKIPNNDQHKHHSSHQKVHFSMHRRITNEWIRCEGCLEWRNIDKELVQQNHATIKQDDSQKDFKFNYCDVCRMSSSAIPISSSSSDSRSIQTESSIENNNSPINRFRDPSLGVFRSPRQQVQKIPLRNAVSCKLNGTTTLDLFDNHTIYRDCYYYNISVPFKRRKVAQRASQGINQSNSKQFSNCCCNQAISQDNLNDNNNKITVFQHRHYKTFHQFRSSNYLQYIISELPFGVKLVLGDNFIHLDLERLRKSTNGELREYSKMEQQGKDLILKEMKDDKQIETVDNNLNSRMFDCMGNDELQDRNNTKEVFPINGYEDSRIRQFKANITTPNIGQAKQKNQRSNATDDDDKGHTHAQQPPGNMITTRSKNIIKFFNNTPCQQISLKRRHLSH